MVCAVKQGDRNNVPQETSPYFSEFSPLEVSLRFNWGTAWGQSCSDIACKVLRYPLCVPNSYRLHLVIVSQNVDKHISRQDVFEQYRQFLFKIGNHVA